MAMKPMEGWFRTVIMGGIGSGKSVVAAALLHILAGKRGGSVAVLDREQGSTWRAEAAMGVLGKPKLVHCRSAERVRQLAATAEGGMVLESATDLRQHLRDSWMAAYTAEKARLNLREPENIPVQAWVQVQAEMISVAAACDKARIPLVEIYGAAAVYVELEDGGGVAETEFGRKARGASSDGGLGASLLLYLDGGLHGNRPMGTRSALVVKDASGLAVGAEIPLPEFRDRGDRRKLVARLREYLDPSIKVCREIHMAEVEAWSKVTDIDAWGAAKRLASQVEGERLQETVRQLLAVAGLDGNTNSAKVARSYRLEKAFGTGYLTTTSLKDAPVDVLRAGVPILRELLTIDEVQESVAPEARRTR